MKKKYAGYINLKPINGVIYPSSLQNILMKEYITSKLKGIFYLSPTEVLQAKYSITLNTLISRETKVSGIVMLSLFSLPKNESLRKNVYLNCLKNKKKLFFILDELSFNRKKDINNIEDRFIFNNKFFTETKIKLTNFEKKLINKEKLTFV